MNTTDIRNLYSFDAWAGERIMEAMQTLNPEEFVRDLHTSYGSLRGILVHIIWAKWLWLERWQGRSTKAAFVRDDFANVPFTDLPSTDLSSTDLSAVRSRGAAVQADLGTFVSLLTDEALYKRIAYINLKGEPREYPLAHMMQHLVNHSSYHRGQIVSLLRQLGKKPPSTDLIIYMDEGRMEEQPKPRSIIYHGSPKAHFEGFDLSTPYVPEDFQREGFIHTTEGREAVSIVLTKYHKARREPWVVLHIDRDRVISPIRYDDPARVYPHIYGPLNRDAILAVEPIGRAEDGTFFKPSM